MLVSLEKAEREAWPRPRPLKIALPAVMPFDPDLLPAALRAYVVDIADRQQSPPDFAAVTAVCGLAAALGNRVRIRPKQHDDWQVVPNLWGAIIGRPSAMKSPAMQSALSPVYALQDDMRRKWEEAEREAAVDDVLSEIDAKDAKKRAAKALKEGDRAGARELLASLAEDDGGETPCPRLIVNDATVEKLGELLNENPRGLMLVRDELPGFLARMESEEYASERAFYLEAFNGDGRFTYDRIGRGTVTIDSCTLSIIGGMQPSRLAPIVQGAVSGLSNDGLIQRLQLAVWPDDVGSWQWVDRHPSLIARDDYESAFRRLHGLELGDGEGGYTALRFTPKAQALFREWMEENQRDARSGRLSQIMESHILKMPKTVASLALIFELVGGGTTAVDAETTARALDWADYLRSHANRIYSAGQTLAEEGARLILERRKQLPKEFTARDVQRKQWSGLADRETVASALDLLIVTHHCRELPQEPDIRGGRPSTVYRWNPCLAESA
ncbi:YfjI family protein [Ancylobacter sp. WKF20]|uniref:YfjI family protein n=1 Tax=Ancylobacter sp. WKF20 TaxID=3039801 RepID=UPI00243418DA|nr:YfjI family protein [Ancylobacter sp. WKF20]WGD32020.1 YfjI family protein [Ancylobacter sp. WKF20]